MIHYELEDDGITTREVYVDERPEWHRHVDAAGILTPEGFVALSQEMRLDEHERRDIV